VQTLVKLSKRENAQNTLRAFDNQFSSRTLFLEQCFGCEYVELWSLSRAKCFYSVLNTIVIRLSRIIVEIVLFFIFLVLW